MTAYLTAALVIEINSRHTGGRPNGRTGASGVAAAVDRMQTSFDGVDKFETIWEKAAVLLHGLSSTQYFTTGNKRTAWLATTVFLEANEIILDEMSDEEAYAFVFTVALNGFEIEQIAQFLRAHRLERQWILDYAFTAETATGKGVPEPGSIELNDKATFEVVGGGVSIFFCEGFPLPLTLGVIVRLLWHSSAAFDRHIIEFQSSDNSVFSVWNLKAAGRSVYRNTPEEFKRTVEEGASLPDEWNDTRFAHVFDVNMSAGHPHHQNWLSPSLITATIPFLVLSAGTVQLLIDVDGERAKSIPLTFNLQAPSSKEILIF